MKKSVLVFIVILILNSMTAYSLAISPSCNNYINGKCEPVEVKETIYEYSYRILNKASEKVLVNLKLETIEGEENRLNLSENTFELESYKQGDCIPENGCKLVKLIFDAKWARPQRYTYFLVAETRAGEESTLPITLQVKAKHSILITPNVYAGLAFGMALFLIPLFLLLNLIYLRTKKYFQKKKTSQKNKDSDKNKANSQRNSLEKETSKIVNDKKLSSGMKIKSESKKTIKPKKQKNEKH